MSNIANLLRATTKLETMVTDLNSLNENMNDRSNEVPQLREKIVSLEKIISEKNASIKTIQSGLFSNLFLICLYT